LSRGAAIRSLVELNPGDADDVLRVPEILTPTFPKILAH